VEKPPKWVQRMVKCCPHCLTLLGAGMAIAVSAVEWTQDAEGIT
jgi:hypothetical protein